MNSIGSGGGYAAMTQGIGYGQRPAKPDASQVASDMFAKLDTKGQGFLEKSDLESAFGKMSGTGSAANAGDAFKALDGDGNGKLTKEEMTSAIQNVFDQIDTAMKSGGMGGMGKGGMPMGAMGGMGGMGPMGGMSPPDGAGLTKDQLTKKAGELSSSDSQLSSLMNDISSNFDAADTDGDGKVSASEARAYAQSQQPSTAASAGATIGGTGSGDNGQLSRQVAQQVMQLVQAYGDQGAGAAKSTVSVSV